MVKQMVGDNETMYQNKPETSTIHCCIPSCIRDATEYDAEQHKTYCSYHQLIRIALGYTTLTATTSSSSPCGQSQQHTGQFPSEFKELS